MWLKARSAPFDSELRPSAQDAPLGGLTDFEYNHISFGSPGNKKVRE
jgi:hypothetical protein